MGMFLGIIGMFGFLGCVIWLIVSAIRLDSKKPPLIGLLVCVVLFFGGMAIDGPSEKTAPDRSENPKAITDISGQDTETLLEDSEQIPDEESEVPDGQPLSSGVYELSGGIKLRFYDSVQEDVTGKWRLSRISSNLAASDYAFEYYETMFSSDDEIHAVWNVTKNTTTRIMALNGMLFVDTLEYVDGEEKSAKLLFSGKLLDSQIIDLATGELQEETEEPESTPAPIPESAPEKTEASAPASAPNTESGTPAAPSQPVNSGGSGSGNGNNFYTYDNAEQQQTEDKWVLNTSTMKIHYPSCREVKKIAPQNYSTSNLEESELIKEGYTTCGVCHK